MARKVSTTSGRFSPTCSAAVRVSPERVEEVAHHYELFGGVSPITELTNRQADGLRQRLAAPAGRCRSTSACATGTRFSPTRCRRCGASGARRAIGFITAAHHSYSSCQQYRENVARPARRSARRRWRHRRHLRPQLVRPSALRRSQCEPRARGARNGCRRTLRRRRADLHRAQHPAVDGGVLVVSRAAPGVAGVSRAARASPTGRWSIRAEAAGRRIPWLEPDVCDYLRQARAQRRAGRGALPDRVRLRSHRGALRPRPRGRRGCAEIGLPMVRAEAVNDDPLFST